MKHITVTVKRFDMKLREALRPLYYFTKLCGQCPYKYDNEKKIYTTDLIAIWYTIVVLLIVHVCLQFFHGGSFGSTDLESVFYPHHDVYFKYFDWIYTTIILIRMCAKVGKMKMVMSNMEATDVHLEKLIGPLDSTYLRTSTIIAVVCFFTNLIIYSLNSVLVFTDCNVVESLTKCFREIFTHSFKIQFCIMMNVCLNRLELLCRYLYSLEMKGKESLDDETLLQHAVEDVHFIHNEICSTSKDISHIFEVQTLIFFVKSIVAGVAAMYTVFRLKDDLTLISTLKIIALVHWTMWRMFCFTVMAYLCQSVLKQVSEIRRAIHKLFREARGQPVKSALRLFSLHEMNRNLHFTVCGLFPMDLTMVHMAIATIATYVLLLIQLSV